MHKNRLAAFLTLFLLSFLVLVSRLACMQIVNHEYYEEVVERTRRSVEIYSGPRGTIRDRNGVVLATDKQVFDASFVLPFLDPLIVVKPTICRVAGIGVEEFEEKLEIAKDLENASAEASIPLIKNISSRTAGRLRHLIRRYPEKYGALGVREKPTESGMAYSLEANIENLCRKERTLEFVSQLLGISYEESLREVNSKKEEVLDITNAYQRRYELNLPYALARNISRDQVEELEVQYKKYPGIIVTTRTQRVHPQGDLACHVLGYLRQFNAEEYRDLKARGRTIRRGFNELEDFEKIDTNPHFIDDMVGATGIERIYNEVLHGYKGARLLESDTRTPERKVLLERPPAQGKSVYLTIDARVQREAQDALAEADIVGAAVVMDVNTGEVVVLASSPSYDLDTFRKDSETFQEHMEKPYPLINRALSGLAPGSGFKLVTAIGALEEGVITPYTRHFCRGYLYRPGVFGCWKKTGHGSITLSTAIEGSCNVYFYIVGEDMGHEKLRKWSHLLGFGRETGIDLPGEDAGLIPSPQWKRNRVFVSREKLRKMMVEFEPMSEELSYLEELSENDSGESLGNSEYYKSLKEKVISLKKSIDYERKRLELFENEQAWVRGDSRNMAIGQGNVLATPLQMARMVAAIANGGTLLVPHLCHIKEKIYFDGRIPVSFETLDLVRQAMHEVVFGRQGTARQKELQKHDVAAKTGTAEIGGDWNNGWIIGYAPFDKPEIAFAVVAERTELHGGDVAGPVAARILDAYFGEKSGREEGN